MRHGILALAGAIGATGALLVAGFFLAFSTLVMRSLDRIAADSAIEAMQSINIIAVRCLLMPVMFGTALLALLLGLAAVNGGSTSWRGPLAIGAVVYLVGTIGVTMAFNVPANNGLAVVMPSASNSSETWAAYSSNWTLWNHIRAVAAGIAGVSFAWGAALIWFGNGAANS